MYIIGLTGSMGSGKSQTASLLKYLRIPVHSADDAVHTLLKDPAVIAEIKRRWPHVVKQDGAVDHKALAHHIFSCPEEVSRLEAILHPRVQALRKKFLMIQARERRKCVVLDIPLLFEKKLASLCDRTVVVSTSALLQHKRLLQRKGMTPVLMNQILRHQLPPHQKRQKADHVLLSGLHLGHLFRQVKRFVSPLVLASPVKWSARWKGITGRRG